MTIENRKWFALEVAQMYLTRDMAARGWVAGQWPIKQGEAEKWLPCLEQVRGCAILLEGQVIRVINKYHLHDFTFTDIREAVPFAEAWAAWSEAQ